MGSMRMTEETAQHEQRRTGDAAFKRAMLRARKLGREQFRIGVDVRPCTEFPAFIPHHAAPPPRVCTIDDL